MNSSAILARTEENTRAHIFTGKPLPKKNFGIIKNPHAQSLRPLLSGEESGNREAQINKLFPRLLKNQLVDKNLIQT